MLWDDWAARRALLPETGRAAALATAERLREAVAGLNLTSGSGDFRVTVSIGIAVMDDGDEYLDSLLGRADTALYLAKSEGRNTVRGDGNEAPVVNPGI
ncbi:MAG: GGDEF domain-containing protein [Deltaproteobacteria bacterium]|nr:GGDEF domain-containing protein [Deltaproteobacteria bacterium]